MIAVRQKKTYGGCSIVVTNVSKEKGILSLHTAKQSASAVMKGEGVRSAAISVVLVNDARIRKINSQFLHHHGVTDVISFPLETVPNLEAEIYINVQQAKRQAKNFGVSVRSEVVRLIVHGALHAVGYDDRRTKQRKIMFEKQEQYVDKIMSGSRNT
jgi:probable rRNA maturation factor